MSSRDFRSYARAPHITPEGYKLLTDEYDSLWNRRKDVIAALSAAAAEGDRSENAEYIYRKKELRSLDHRIHYLQKRLPQLKIVNEISDTSRVFFGARISLLDENGNSVNVRIVGTDELDFEKNNISIDSPLARILLGKSENAKVVLKLASGSKNYRIIEIRY